MWLRLKALAEDDDMRMTVFFKGGVVLHLLNVFNSHEQKTIGDHNLA